MPISSSAKKANRSSEKKRLANLKFKEELKSIIKKTKDSNLSKTFSMIDKAVKKHLLHAHKASRIKSQLSKKFSGNVKTQAKPAKKAKVKRTAKTKK